MATMKTLNGYGFNATELNGKTSDSYLQLGDDGTGSTGAAPTINAGTFGGMTVGQFVDMIYPVGSIYMSASATSPASLFGGTWESIGGRFLLGADATYAAGSTGGEAAHTLSTHEIPHHYHNSYCLGLSGTMDAPAYYAVFNRSAYTYNYAETTSKALDVASTSVIGGDQPHNNMPPYLAVYMWQRTA